MNAVNHKVFNSLKNFKECWKINVRLISEQLIGCFIERVKLNKKNKEQMFW